MLQTPLPQKPNGKIHRRDLIDKVENRGSVKDFMARVTDAQPDAYESYKDRARRQRPILTPEDLEIINPQPKEIDREAVVAETRRPADGVDDVWQATRTVTAAMTTLFYPLLQHPRKLPVQSGRLGGIAMANIGDAGLLWNGRRRFARTESPNVLILTSLCSVDDATLSEFDARDLMREHNAGLIFVVGPAMTQRVQGLRASLAETGVVVVTTRELAQIAEETGEPEIALDALENLIAA
jgi:hypothetical protein